MNTGAILIGLAILILMVPWVAGPFRKTKVQIPVQDVQVESGLPGKRVEVLSALRDLDFDYQTGKVARVDYTQIRADLMAQAAELLQLEKQKELAIEALIRARREKLTQSVSCPDCHHILQSSDRFCPRCGNHVNRTCPACGAEIQPSHNFCPKCGTRQVNQSAPENIATTN